MAKEPTQAERGDARWEEEEKAARRVYWWLLLSPFVTVPCFASQLFSLYWRSSVGERVWAAIVPLVFHIPLLLMSFTARSRFVRRHTQQAMLLVALRASMAAISLNLGHYPYEGLCPFFLGNGALWLFGNQWGLRQVKHGDCWLMRRKGEDGELPRPWAVPAEVPAITATDAPMGTAPTSVAPSPAAASSDPNAAFEDGLRLLSVGRQSKATACFLAAFRTGSPDLRRQAAAELEKLGEVEAL